ncbi:DUF4870 domain-containing protein [Alkalibacillus haloalkaliphilus]|uniref:DUF4870 domain-containing protein n=1 Tax=Alkalibacillus haloalkaliphilus TaxID=94136 RepID=A0A511W2I8_9BACI|nr:DUF4870 domain-containing protein [Alkalibacillus haloalkaliphilus]GEN45299.1 hypothetical protein AHA02nite_10750 [Alkalibacillus haloalkaliphilus]
MQEVITTKDRLMVAFGYLLPMIFPLSLLNIVITLVYWYVAPYQSPFFDHHMKENINAQISYQLYIFVSFVLFFVFGWLGTSYPGAMPDVFQVMLPLATFGFIGIIALIILFWWVIFVIAIIASIAKKYFRFPLIIRFIR